jgi:hypothetical protein
MTPTLNVATCFESFIIVRVAIPKAPDLECNGNLVPDLCDPNEDCNSNGVQDVCDIGTGFSLDTNENLVPDECDECIADFVACADLDGDLIRDDNCTWWECIQGDCVGTDIHFGDMGGSGGNCTHDGVVDGHDIYHALYCFVNKSLNGANPYPCDANAPQALHSDAGGRFGSCEPDGVGDIHDVYHVMNVFNGVSPCSTCPLDDPEGPAPAARRTRAGQSQVNSVRVFMAVDGLQAVSPTTGNTVLSMDPGTTAQVMMWIQALPPASGLLESYQLVLSHPALPQSGATGTVAYVNVPDEWGQSIKIDQDNADWVFTDLPPHPTYPLESDSHGLFGVAFYGAPGNAVDPAASSGAHYLAEFEIEASSHAQGEFELRFVVQAIPGNPQPLSALVGHQGTEYVVDEFQNLTILVGVPQCAESADCADVDDDGVRDDNCMWWTCARDVCLATDIVFADLGGAFGGCAPDGTADANDRFHALNCFSNSNTSGGPGYPCEVSPPQAFNVDAGGPFGVCQPDGVCDGNDAFHALNAFQGSATCSCPSGPEPTAPQPPVVVAAANIQLQADRSAVRAGEILEVEAFLATGLPDLRGYQLHVSVRGGTTGRLDLVDIAVQDREDAAFAGPADWQAFNIATRQMLAGLDGPGIKAGAGAYLATLVFRASDDAHGRFVVDLLHSGTDPAQRTFLFPTPPGSKITIDSVTPAVILVDRREDPTRRK